MQGSILMVGGGKMARALAQGMLASQVISPQRLRVVDRNAASRAWWQQTLPEVTVYPDASTAELDAACGVSDTVILAVKPYQLANCIGTLRSHHPHAWRQSLVISVAAGILLEKLEEWLDSRRVARVMPNTPSLVQSGASAYCVGEGVDDEDVSHLQTLLSSIGLAMQVPESQIDAVTGVSGSGPAYVFLFIEALADGGVRAGLPRDKALRLAAQTVLGAARLVQESGEHPGVLKDAVASPGGTTIAAIAALEQNAFRSAVIEAVTAAAKRSAEMQ